MRVPQGEVVVAASSALGFSAFTSGKLETEFTCVRLEDAVELVLVLDRCASVVVDDIELEPVDVWRKLGEDERGVAL